MDVVAIVTHAAVLDGAPIIEAVVLIAVAVIVAVAIAHERRATIRSPTARTLRGRDRHRDVSDSAPHVQEIQGASNVSDAMSVGECGGGGGDC
jgi:hypothetical protein